MEISPARFLMDLARPSSLSNLRPTSAKVKSSIASFARLLATFFSPLCSSFPTITTGKDIVRLVASTGPVRKLSGTNLANCKGYGRCADETVCACSPGHVAETFVLPLGLS